MDTTHFDELLRSLATAPSRRAVLAGLAIGLVAAGPFALGANDADARKDGKRKKKRRKNRKNQQQPLSPLPPPPPPPPPAPAPGPSTRIDATCPESTGNSGITSINGDVRMAQTFTAVASGPLVRAELSIKKLPSSSGDYILRLSPLDAVAVPTNEVLAETSVANSAVADGDSTVPFIFTTPFSVVPGTQYALVLTRPGSTSLEWEGQLGDTCPGGTFLSADQTAPFEVFVSSLDLIFTTFVSS